MGNALSADTYIGKWTSNAGQTIVIRRLPFGRMFANYHPNKGWPRLLRDCTLSRDANELVIRLTWVFGTWMALKPVSHPDGSQPLLEPKFLPGPNGAYEAEAHDCPWALPLTVFHRLES